ncbi:TetR family transcriptional regulator [Mycobacterium xenopi]|uniref:HTH-type transcriptional repressor KstR n=1 Tax=Mycobacterium xenopi 4042 TaxID=1299334 RepID=X8AEQ7_MYCXE|nr:TetR family transcriptional regulator [Mycobacterium xenopi]EUA30387.1 HTH-type transcriptional repressor KstR [Mycobacterium xenopi 4042]EUA51094.1 HTH-type transcriptional repressor KstR [Mycobacterium xenopi 3993]MDA3641914.1 TetR family transcriptional regulator [Mycobacterium xenopi]MDA3658778.1 TetR family transcriptional regulator [Mycobacterium xenopi]MDA3664187.1 TetR family transcriptional regulator [Mycobacterium xenopi]
MSATVRADVQFAAPQERQRRAMILDAALAIGSEGGYDAVQMRKVAERADVGVATLYRYFPSKVHLLVSVLGHQFQRFDASCDWTATEDTPYRRLRRVIDRVNEEWQHNLALTDAMTRAFVFAGASAAEEVAYAANVFEGMLARALSGGEPSEEQHEIARVICDVWIANLTVWLTRRVPVAEVCQRLDHAMRLLVGDEEHPKI